MPARADSRSEVFFMLISAAIFTYFGFGMSWVHKYTTTQPPQLLPMVGVLEWTLKSGAIVFGLSAVLTMIGQRVGGMLYAIAGLVTAGIFIVVAVWQWTNAQGYFSGIDPLLLVIFAAWNGFGSWSSLRDMLAAPRAEA